MLYIAKGIALSVHINFQVNVKYKVIRYHISFFLIKPIAYSLNKLL